MPVSKINISLGVENEQAGAGREGTAEPNSRDKSLIRERGQLIMSSFDKSTPG